MNLYLKGDVLFMKRLGGFPFYVENHALQFAAPEYPVAFAPGLDLRWVACVAEQPQDSIQVGDMGLDGSPALVKPREFAR